MPARDACEATRARGPELALGIADGRERAEALEHLASCAECRADLARLTDVADELLALVPSHEPAVGFESRVATAIEDVPPASASMPGRRLPRRRLRLAIAVAATAVLAATATAAGLLALFHGDRELADQYRAALDRVGGQYFEAARLHDDEGAAVGKVFGYQGKPSWLLVLVYAQYRHAPFAGALVTTTGASVPLASLEIDADRATWGGAIPVDLREVALVRLTGEQGNVYHARLPAAPGE